MALFKFDLNIVAPAWYVVAEGDSITNLGLGDLEYPGAAKALLKPAFVSATNLAVAGSTIADLVARAAACDAQLQTGLAKRNFLSVLIGRNNLGTGATNGEILSFCASVATYCDARRAAGWFLIICTLTPSTLTDFNANRAVADPIFRSWIGTHADAVCDFAADPTMGPDAAASDTNLYSDGTHPTILGRANLGAVYAATLNSL